MAQRTAKGKRGGKRGRGSAAAGSVEASGKGKRTRRRYSDRERGEALAVVKACGGNLTEAAGRVGVPRRTLANWAANKRGEGPPAETVEAAERDLAGLFEDAARKYLAQAVAKVSDTGGYQSMLAAGIAIDKARLLRGEATAIQGGAVQFVISGEVNRGKRDGDGDGGEF